MKKKKSVSASSAPTKYMAKIQYLGTRYHGWQIQNKGRTIQGVLMQELAVLAGQPIKVIGASRTDSGVHALGQVAHFHFPFKQSVPDLRKTLNARLPWDIRIQSLKPAHQDFHAQKDAIKKRYCYQIYTGDFLPPFLHNRCLHVPGLKGYERMAEASREFLGTHDFSSFAASRSEVKNKVRTIYESRLTRKGYLLTYRVEANGFLHHMIRNMVGTLIEIGQDKLEINQIEAIFHYRDRRWAGPTVKPEGLVLTRIWY